MIKTGVYLIKNVINNKVYVGSCSNKYGIPKRIAKHKKLLKDNKHHNCHLQHAWNKYGQDAFEFSILVLCIPELCILHEQLFIDQLKASNRQFGYNISPTAGNVLGMKLSKEARQKISDNNKGRVMSTQGRNNISIANKGRKHSKETRDKVAEAGRGRLHSSETKSKMSDSAVKREAKRRFDRLMSS